MATVNKNEVARQATGLPSKEQILTAPENIDTVPAALTQGEFVFSLPAIIALGQGDHAAGLQVLEQLHEELRAVGVPMVEEMQGTKGIAGAAPPLPTE